MVEPFIGEMRMFGFAFAPSGWAHCDGQILEIEQNTALFAILGATYGGDNKSTFALPDLAGRAALDAGQGPDLSLYDRGQVGGDYSVWLGFDEMPSHTHTMMGSSQPANQGAPATNRTLASSAGGAGYQTNTTENLTEMNYWSLVAGGDEEPHNNVQPSLALNFCIALEGIFPPRGPTSPEPQAPD